MQTLARLRASLRNPEDQEIWLQAAQRRILRRRRIVAKAESALSYLGVILVLAGYAFLFALPFPALGRATYLSENAIQPAQVNTYWSWGEVHAADRHAENIESWAHSTSAERARAIDDCFTRHGLRSALQNYSFAGDGQYHTGTNVYSLLRGSKTDGAETLVLAASWRSRHENRINIRGVALVLAMSKHLSRLPVWSKDIIFLVSDGYADGMMAWLESWHGVSQRTLVADRIEIRGGPLWAALMVDYPHHSFDHLDLYFEAVNGLLPNLDFVNTAVHIARWAGGSPIRLGQLSDELRDNPSHGTSDFPIIGQYARSLRYLSRQISGQAMGLPKGPEGLFARFRIDALALSAVPAEGPHGFFSLGKIVESTFRSLNNLLERFHQSFFLYLLTGPDAFISIGNYLPAPLLVSAGLTVQGIAQRIALFSRESPTAARVCPSTFSHAEPLSLHAVVIIFYILWCMIGLQTPRASTVMLVSVAAILPTIRRLWRRRTTEDARCVVLIAAGVALALVSTVNFSLGVLSSLALGLPLIVSCWLPSGITELVSIFAPLLWVAMLHGRISRWTEGVQHEFELEPWVATMSWTLPFVVCLIMPTMAMYPVR